MRVRAAGMAAAGVMRVRAAGMAATGVMSFRGACLAAALVATLAAAGCGGSLTPAQRVAATIKAWGRAVAAGDGPAACAQMQPGFEPLATCEGTIATDGTRLTASQKALFRNLQVVSVKVSGNQATAVVKYGGQVQHPKLKLYAGHWRLVESVQL